MSDLASFSRRFEQRYGVDPEVIVRAPGRVEIIGGHTDYNDGFVLPMAIDRQCVVLGSRRADGTVRLFSELFDAGCVFELSASLPPGKPAWANYAKGVAALLLRAGKSLCGMDLYVFCDVPSGGGLSSSAALEVAYAKAFLAGGEQTFEPTELALLCQEAEHSFAGAPCGIMDQFVCVLARSGQALLLDCRSHQYEYVPVPSDRAGLVIADTKVKHDLGQSEYPVRRAQCEQAATILGRREGTVKALRDVNADMLERHGDMLEGVLLARARHIVGENQRVSDAAAGFRSGDLSAAGAAMSRSHDSLRDDYEVSCEELDFLVDQARQCEGVYGARMSGGGFGGCMVALMDLDAGQAVRRRLTEAYGARFGLEPGVFMTGASSGAEVLQS